MVATSAGVVAAVQATMLGKKAVIVDLGYNIGGMTTSGLSATDIGNKHVIGGLSRKFLPRLRQALWTGRILVF